MGGLSLNYFFSFFFLSVCLIFNTSGIFPFSHFSGNTIFYLTKQKKEWEKKYDFQLLKYYDHIDT